MKGFYYSVRDNKIKIYHSNALINGYAVIKVCDLVDLTVYKKEHNVGTILGYTFNIGKTNEEEVLICVFEFDCVRDYRVKLSSYPEVYVHRNNREYIVIGAYNRDTVLTDLLYNKESGEIGYIDHESNLKKLVCIDFDFVEHSYGLEDNLDVIVRKAATGVSGFGIIGNKSITIRRDKSIILYDMETGKTMWNNADVSGE